MADYGDRVVSGYPLHAKFKNLDRFERAAIYHKTECPECDGKADVPLEQAARETEHFKSQTEPSQKLVAEGEASIESGMVILKEVKAEKMKVRRQSQEDEVPEAKEDEKEE